MLCSSEITEFGLRSIGFGERRLPVSQIEFCDQLILIGSGLIWNIYLTLISVFFGFFLAIFIATLKFYGNRSTRIFVEIYIVAFRGSPLIIQFFIAYMFFLQIKTIFPELAFLTSVQVGAALVLVLNTAAYSAEIFFGALCSVTSQEIEAADAYGISGWRRLRKVMYPTMLRLGWPAYTNEVVFMFHSTALVFFASFPAWQQRGDALYYANYFAEKTFNPFVAYPIFAGYFIFLTLMIIFGFATVQRKLNAHLNPRKKTIRRFRFLINAVTKKNSKGQDHP